MIFTADFERSRQQSTECKKHARDILFLQFIIQLSNLAH